MSAELKPCPFCGSTDVRFMGSFDDRGGVAVYCAGDGCDCTMGANWDRDALPDHAYRDEEQAAKAWNRRATLAPGAPGQEAQQLVTPNKIIALAEKCSAEVGRYEGQVVWVKFHSLASVEAFATGIVLSAAIKAYTPVAAQEAAAVQAVGACQDIATAPKGQNVLLLRAAIGRICVDDWGLYDAYNQPKFTHWQPLPALPPSGAGEKTS